MRECRWCHTRDLGHGPSRYAISHGRGRRGCHLTRALGAGSPQPLVGTGPSSGGAVSARRSTGSNGIGESLGGPLLATMELAQRWQHWFADGGEVVLSPELALLLA